MARRENFFREHAVRFTAALKTNPDLTLSKYCRDEVISYDGLRKWMFVHNMKPTSLKKTIRKEHAAHDMGMFVQMQNPKSVHDAAIVVDRVFHDARIELPGGIVFSVGSADAESLLLVVKHLVQICSH